MTRILVVEDDFDTRYLITLVLRGARYETREAESAEQALEVLKNEQPIDLLVSDIVMAGVNGLQLLEHVRKQYPALPVILLSAHVGAYWVQSALQKGAACCLLKPFTREQLITIVGDVLSSGVHMLPMTGSKAYTGANSLEYSHVT